MAFCIVSLIYFNCTIQELKLTTARGVRRMRCNFNCTIQELKQISNFLLPFLETVFQLHHTGIKTTTFVVNCASTPNFNCTIQELKLSLGLSSP